MNSTEKNTLAEVYKAITKLKSIEWFKNSVRDIRAFKVEDWSDDKLQESLNQLLEETGQKPGILFQIIRISLTWAPFSPALNQTLRVIGKNESIKRLKNSFREIEKM